MVQLLMVQKIWKLLMVQLLMVQLVMVQLLMVQLLMRSDVAAGVLLVIVVGVRVADLARPALDDVIRDELQLEVVAHIVAVRAERGADRSRRLEHAWLLGNGERLTHGKLLLLREPVVEAHTEIQAVVR